MEIDYDDIRVEKEYDKELRLAKEKWEKMSRRSKLKAWIHFIFFQTYEDHWFGFKIIYPPLIILLLLLGIITVTLWIVTIGV